MADKNYIFFNPREWTLIQGGHGNARYERFFADNPVRGGMTEMVEMSNFGNCYTRIGRRVHLQKHTMYHFVFWLNGGENDARTEVCNLLVLNLDNMDAEVSQYEWDHRSIYKLNRSYINPLKHCRGWELYDICFQTGEQENVLLCFEMDKAPTAVIQAEAVESYDDLEDEFDELAAYRPQRHNIVFTDGWPINSWYSTEALRLKKTDADLWRAGNHGPLTSLADKVVEQLSEECLDELCDSIVEDIREDLVEEIRGTFRQEIKI